MDIKKNRMKRIQKDHIPFYVLVMLLGILMPIYGVYKRIILNDRSVYTIAKIDNVSSGGKQGLSYGAYYFYKQKKYSLKFTAYSFENLKMESLIFIKIDTLNPRSYILIDFSTRPSCFVFDDAPLNGWKELPTCN